MLSVLPNIPVVIQPKHGNIEPFPDETARSHDLLHQGFLSCSSTSSSVVARFLRDEHFKDSVQFLQFICNSDSNTDFPQANGMFVSGGLQRYLIENRCREENSTASRPEEHGNNDLHLLDLPDCIQLHIFSFLDAKTLCTIASVCLRWCTLGNDDLLWQRRLRWDVDTWNVIGDTTNPSSYDPVDWTPKEIYLRCSPAVAEFSKRSNFVLHRLSDIFRSLWPKKSPRVAMFGPGLESRTSFLVRKILEDRSGLFKTLKMFPGQFDGVGSGFRLSLNNCISLDLITIYNATKEERERWKPEDRLRNSRMLSRNSVADEETHSEVTFELNQNIKDLCRTLDGFIFVVDATSSSEELSLARPELFAMTDNRLSPGGAPVLVLSCTPDSGTGHPLSCRRVVQQLQLQRLNRPWQVHNCCLETMDGIESAIHWAVQTSHRS